MDESTEQKQLETYFAARHGGGTVWISNYRKSSSGASNETRLLTLNVRTNSATVSTDLVVRWAPPGSSSLFQKYDVAFQYRMMKALAGTAVPVPRMIAYEEDGAVLGSAFVVMEYVSGAIASDYPPGCHGAGFLFEATPQQREHVWWRSLEVMAAVNRIDWRQSAFQFMDRPRDGADALNRRLTLFRNLARWVSDKPIAPVERALAWLERKVPADLDLALCWSDGRPGNIIFRDFEPVAALDWEGAYIGPPENDLALFILVDEVAYNVHGQKRLEGLPDAQATIRRYEELIGRSVKSFHYFLVMQCAWLALIVAQSAKTASAKGITGFPEDYASNNFTIARLQELLAKAS